MVLCVYMNLSLLLFFFSLINMLFFLKYLFLGLSLYIEFNLVSLSSMNLSFMIFFDYKSFLFISSVLMISSMIMIYSLNYMSGDKTPIRFILILFLFVVSMLLMIVCQNLLMIMLGWDGLGLISYCLVIYYNSWNSFNSGMVTVLTNRLGDIGLLISIGIFSCLGDWNFLLISFESLLLLIMLSLAFFTKSAQVPFSSWLPMAMAAPTPVSALVHSSTLVTAGVYLMIRLDFYFYMNFKFYLLFFFLMTSLMSGLVAMFENDLKKVIALSTLSQLGFMMVGVGVYLKDISFFHLITHAMFKSLLFMCAGIILHSMSNIQDVRLMGCLNKNFYITLMMFSASSLALCGFPFFSGFYSKDMLIDTLIFFGTSVFFSLVFYISVFTTIIYSFRLVYYLILSEIKYFKYMNLSDCLLMNFSMLFMFMMSIVSGSMMFYLMMSLMVMVNLDLNFKLLINLFFLIILFSLNMFFDYYLNLNLKFLINYLSSIFLLNYLSNLISKNYLLVSLKVFYLVEIGWLDFILSNFLKSLFMLLYKIENLNFIYLMSMIYIFYNLFLILI